MKKRKTDEQIAEDILRIFSKKLKGAGVIVPCGERDEDDKAPIAQADYDELLDDITDLLASNYEDDEESDEDDDYYDE